MDVLELLKTTIGAIRSVRNFGEWTTIGRESLRDRGVEKLTFHRLFLQSSPCPTTRSPPAPSLRPRRPQLFPRLPLPQAYSHLHLFALKAHPRTSNLTRPSQPRHVPLTFLDPLNLGFPPRAEHPTLLLPLPKTPSLRSVDLLSTSSAPFDSWKNDTDSPTLSSTNRPSSTLLLLFLENEPPPPTHLYPTHRPKEPTTSLPSTKNNALFQNSLFHPPTRPSLPLPRPPLPHPSTSAGDPSTRLPSKIWRRRSPGRIDWVISTRVA